MDHHNIETSFLNKSRYISIRSQLRILPFIVLLMYETNISRCLSKRFAPCGWSLPVEHSLDLQAIHEILELEDLSHMYWFKHHVILLLLLISAKAVFESYAHDQQHDPLARTLLPYATSIIDYDRTRFDATVKREVFNSRGGGMIFVCRQKALSEQTPILHLKAILRT